MYYELMKCASCGDYLSDVEMSQDLSLYCKPCCQKCLDAEISDSDNALEQYDF